jgi:hypothetical protein
MKLLTFFVLLGVAEQALAGGTSKCGPLIQSFTPLLQTIESLVDFFPEKIDGEKFFK